MGRNPLIKVYLEAYSGKSWIDRWIINSGRVKSTHCVLRLISIDNTLDISLHTDAKQACWVSSLYLQKLYKNKYKRNFILDLGTTDRLVLKADCWRFSRLIMIIWWYLFRWFVKPGRTPGCLRASTEAANLLKIKLPKVWSIDELIEHYDCTRICRPGSGGEK